MEWQWVHVENIKLDGVNPIGIAQGENGLWLSDGDHNRVVLIDAQGSLIKSVDSLDRPMHIDHSNNLLYIPQYGNDWVIEYDYTFEEFPLPVILRSVDSLDAPAGVSRFKGETAIADFYNNKIHYSENGLDWITFGKEGKEEGDFYYPTDVQITEDKIWVADAYNNRIQVFDKNGGFIRVIGEGQNMNAATGIYVSNNEVFTTDFENNRVLIFTLDGILKQIITDDIQKPTDILLSMDKLYVTNYKGSSLSVYEWKEVVVTKKEDDEHHHEDHNHDE